MDIIQRSDEHRISVRFKTDFAAQVTVQAGDQFNALVSNISLSGLQLCCDHLLVKALMSKLETHNTTNPIRFSLFFNVATTLRTHVPVEIICQQIYMRRLGDNSFLLGCQFESFKHGSEAALHEHLHNFGVSDL